MEGGSLKRFEIEPVLLDTYIYIYIYLCVCLYGRMAEIEACYTNRDGLSGRRRLRRKRNRIVSLGRGNPFVGALHSSVLICPYLLRLVSSSSFSTSLSLSLFPSRRVLGLLNQPSNQPSKQQRKAPRHTHPRNVDN